MNLITAENLARDLMRENGLEAQGWTFAYDRAVRRFGSCSSTKRRITLSRKIVELNDITHVKNTILHEIAHALAGHKAGHGAAWKSTARALGCSAERCYSSEVTQPDYKRPSMKQGTCPNCDRRVYRRRRMAIACGVCCRKYNNNKYSEAYLIQWQQ